MTKIPQLYDIFSQQWEKYDNIKIIGDLHLGDADLEQYFEGRSTDEIITILNKNLTKNDLLICLGDLGEDYRRLCEVKCDKVLITGNHDVGATKLKRHKQTFKYDCDAFTRKEAFHHAKEKYGRYYNISCGSDEHYSLMHQPFTYWEVEIDNGLFNEVYDAPLTIGPKLILSHEPIGCNWALNLHGHTHSKDWADDKNHLDLCGEKRNYVPLNLKAFIKQGGLKNIESLHRQTIDTAVRNSKAQEKEKSEV